MMRMVLPRWVNTVTSTRPSGSAPRQMKRSSPLASGSVTTSACGSSRESAASAKRTLCFLRFAAALAGSHSYPSVEPIVCTFVHRSQANAHFFARANVQVERPPNAARSAARMPQWSPQLLGGRHAQPARIAAAPAQWILSRNGASPSNAFGRDRIPARR